MEGMQISNNTYVNVDGTKLKVKDISRRNKLDDPEDVWEQIEKALSMKSIKILKSDKN